MTSKEKQHLIAILDIKIKHCKDFLNRTDSGKYCVRRETATKQAIVLDLSTILAEIEVITWDRWEEVGRLIELCDDESCDTVNCNSYVNGKCKWYVDEKGDNI